MQRSEREYDVVVWGATGFTGALCVKYLVQSAPAHLRWAIGGRNREKLEKVKRQYSAQDCDIVVADAADRASLEAMAARTRVVMTTVGPFILYGTLLVEACLRQQTDYVDITGESLWVRGLIDKYHDEAVRKGVCIVPMCGFDSIPSDLGALFVISYAQRELNAPCARVQSYISTNAAPSGGTLATAFTLMELGDTEFVDNLFYLNPDKESKKPTRFEKDHSFVGCARAMSSSGKWTAPFVMGSVNTRVVRRSAALMPQTYGESFAYNECAHFKRLYQACVVWLALTIGVVVLVVLAKLGKLNLARRFAPKPGEGPSEETRRKSWFQYEIIAEIVAPKGKKGRKIKATIHGGDPGYDETAKMLSESAMCLALQRDELPLIGRRGGIAGGVLTPATCMGELLVQRLAEAGIVFAVEEKAQ